MRHSCAVCSLTVALCLVVFVSASTSVTKQEATTAVEDAKAFVKTVRDTAQNQLENVNRLLDKVETFKREAEKAALKSQTAPNDNTEAVAIATEVKSLSEAVENSYSDAKRKLVTVVNSLTTVLEEAKQFVSESTIEITPNTDTTDEFSETKGRATTLKGKAEDLNRKITAAVTPVAAVESTAKEMANKTTEAQLKDSQVSAIVAVAKIESMLENADNIIPQIEGKRNEVNGIVHEVKTLKTTPSVVPDENIKALQQSAEDALTDAKGAVDNANNAKAEIQKQKGLANTALTNVKEEKQDVSKAEGEVQKVEDCVTAAGQSFSQLNNALQTVKTSLKTANDLKKEMETALSTATSDLSNKQEKETAQSDSPVRQTTEPHQKDTTIQPMSKDLPSQNSSSADKLKDALSTGAQNVPTTALTGGKAPAPGAKNDSAMTVSVPLLVALIASAVLQ